MGMGMGMGGGEGGEGENGSIRVRTQRNRKSVCSRRMGGVEGLRVERCGWMDGGGRRWRVGAIKRLWERNAVLVTGGRS